VQIESYMFPIYMYTNHCISSSVNDRHSTTRRCRTSRPLHPDFLSVVVVRKVDEAIVDVSNVACVPGLVA